MALEYLLKGPTASGEQVKAEVKSNLSDEHIKVSYTYIVIGTILASYFHEKLCCCVVVRSGSLIPHINRSAL